MSQWVAAHEELAGLVRRRAELDGVEGSALLRAFRVGVHRYLGFANFAEYVERLFGYSRRTLDDKLRTAEALEGLPELSRSLRDGVVNWSVARELARVATAETEREWIDATRGRPVHEVERLVSGRGRGARPGDAQDAAEQRHVLRFEVSAETFATFREAMKASRQRSNQPLDDDSALLLIAREILFGPTDAGRANYQIALDICEQCKRGLQETNGELVEVDEAVVAMAECDAQHVGRTSGDRAHVGTESTSESTHVGERARATQTIPPALRRRVLRRDHGRCVVPGCRHSTFVDLHHIDARADGGAHDEINLIVLCSAHHRAQHRGRLSITGNVAEGLIFRRSDGSAYGSMSAASEADAFERAFRGLRGLGFREKEARNALRQVLSEAAAPGRKPEESTERLLRNALALLTTPSSSGI
jgi:hypothetical protein